MSQPWRIADGRLVDRTRRLTFRFDGRRLEGHPGDTLAAALLANGSHLVGRSFKYHRPRGIVAAGAEEPNALVELRTAARREPNTRATEIELFQGLDARSQNRRGSLRFDLMAMNQWFAPFLAAGFYYKTFKGPRGWWERVYEPLIRRAAGLGRAATAADPDSYEEAHLHCDVLVVGAGPAGLAAADAARQTGARVVLAEQAPAVGGTLLGERDGLDAWVGEVASGFVGDDARLLTRTTVFGYYDHDVLLAVERVADHLPTAPPHTPRQRLWVIRAREVVLATGSHERPLLFADNDRPGIMLAGAVRCYLNAFGVAAGGRVVVATATDDAYRTALDLHRAGVAVPAIVDVREAPGAIAGEAEAAGIEVLTGEAPLRAVGARRVRGLEVGDPDHPRLIPCDAVAVSGGFSPALHLASQSGAKPVFDAAIQGFVPGSPVQHERSAGAARGLFDLAAVLEDGRRAGLDGAEAAGFSAGALTPLPTVPAGDDVLWPPPLVPATDKAFVDLQNDVATGDLRLAVREGYDRAEHAKRYTTLGMGTDQGKTANVNGLAVLAEATGRPLAEMAPTTFRPPYTAVAVGNFAGHARGPDYQPVRRSAMHRWHERNGAVFVEAGHWLRPRYYPKDEHETLMEAAAREAIAVRRRVGLCDVSTLGKIEIFGADARTFLNHVYINAWSKLPPLKARYGLMLREDGLALDDGTTSCLADDHFLMTTTTANAAKVLQHLEFLHQTAWPELDVAMASATEQWCAMALAGPKSREVLRLVLDGADVSNAALPFMGVLETTAGGVFLRVFRISFSGELAYELACPWGYGEALWARCMQAGAAFGITPYGTEALSILRIEKGHPAGQELDGRTTATDLGLARMVSRTKSCVGRVLAGRPGLADPERPALVGLRPVDPDARLRGGAHLVRDPQNASSATDLGWTSSVHYSPHVGSYIALAFAAGGLERWQGQRLWAVYPLKDEAVEVEVTHPCFVDPEGERLRG